VAQSLGAALLAVLVLVALGSASTAVASSVRSDGSVVRYVAAPGEHNRLAAGAGQAGSMRISDAGAQIAVGPGCTAAGAGAVDCAGSTLDAQLMDGADSLGVPGSNHGEDGLTHDCCASPQTPLDVRASLGSGDDRLAVAVNGDASIDGGSGNDSAWLFSQDGSATGAGGNDLLAMSVNGNGQAHGGDGNDRLVVSTEGGALLDGQAGNDRLTGGGQGIPSWTYLGGAGNDVFSFACDDPRCTESSAGEASAAGGPGQDHFRAFPRLAGSPRPRDAVMSGGAGLDLADYSTSTADLTITLDGVQNDGEPGTSTPDNVGSDVEGVVAGGGDDRLVGSSFANLLVGNAGNDDVTGAGGHDALFGSAGNDTMRSRDGLFDFVSCGSGLDRVSRDPGDETRGCETRF
jgi:Ca2+-binding RTX toxin-like protein